MDLKNKLSYTKVILLGTIIFNLISQWPVMGWNLSDLDLFADYRVLHVSIYYVRAFLSIESTSRNTSECLLNAFEIIIEINLVHVVSTNFN